MNEFTEFPKMARLSRECIITEKIDGTNASVVITDDGQFLIGSRTRYITPENDNYGFARWCMAHKDELLTLGVGRHFGEWWGGGVQRNYGLQGNDKRFWLFNTLRWCLPGQTPKVIGPQKTQEILPACCGLVPVLFEGIFTTDACDKALADLKENGSRAVPGFMKPEGIVCYHIAAGVGFKKTIEKDELPKSLAGLTGN